MDGTDDRDSSVPSDPIEDRNGEQIHTTRSMHHAKTTARNISNDGDGRMNSSPGENIEIILNSSPKHKTSGPAHLKKRRLRMNGTSTEQSWMHTSRVGARCRKRLLSGTREQFSATLHGISHEQVLQISTRRMHIRSERS